MGIRETINAVHPAIIGTVVAAVLGVGVWVGVRSLGTPGNPEGDRVMVLKCTRPECGQVMRVKFSQVQRQQRTPDDLPGAPALTCDKCGQATQAYAYECPTHHEVFSPAADGRAKCPQCGWDPIQERQKEVMRRMNQGAK